MNTLVQRIVVSNRQNVFILNRLNKSQSYSKCIRQTHFLNNQCFSLATARLVLPTLAQNVSKTTIVYIPNRLKYDRKSPKSNNDSDDENDDDGDNLDDFRDGKSDKVTQIKVQTLRLDSVIKAGLNLSKKSIEKLFYDSKIRVNGKKITKKSMDITGKCEIDVIKGPSPDNPNFLVVGRVEVLSVTSDGLYFTLTVRRNKSLTIENYVGGGQFGA